MSKNLKLREGQLCSVIFVKKYLLLLVLVVASLLLVCVVYYREGDGGTVDADSDGTGLDREELFAARRAHLRAACRRHSDSASYGGVTYLPLRYLWWHTKRNLVVCHIPKVATTTWAKYLLKDAYPEEFWKLQQSSNNDLHIIANTRLVPRKQQLKEQTIEQLANSKKVITSRHPFVRIVSAYKHKVEPCLTQSECYAKTNVKEWKSLVNFKSFVEFLVEHVHPADKKNNKAEKYADPHWRPYHRVCAPCDVDYDYIVKIETWQDDMTYLLSKFDFKQDEDFHGNNLNSSAVAVEYMQTLPRPLLMQLYERYLIDFELFDYTIDEYLS